MYKLLFINHVKAVKSFLQRHNGHANINVDTCELEVRVGSQIKKFLPQFALRTNDQQSAYTPRFDMNVTGFIGWLPYQLKRWELSTEKLKIKEYLLKHGIPTPAYSTDPNVEMPNVIIKRSQSSFGDNIKGPFRSSQESKIDVGAGEYYERFIMGKIVKIWYWNTLPVNMEIMAMPRLQGNGQQSIREIYQVQEKDRDARCPDVDECADLLSFQGYTANSVLGNNESVALDFKYLSPLIRVSPKNRAVLCSEDHILYPQLRAIGEVLWQAIPEGLRHHTAYSVDAMLDMNSNPQLHPDIYPTMLESLFFNREFRYQVNPPEQI